MFRITDSPDELHQDLDQTIRQLADPFSTIRDYMEEEHERRRAMLRPNVQTIAQEISQISDCRQLIEDSRSALVPNLDEITSSLTAKPPNSLVGSDFLDFANREFLHANLIESIDSALASNLFGIDTEEIGRAIAGMTEASADSLDSAFANFGSIFPGQTAHNDVLKLLEEDHQKTRDVADRIRDGFIATNTAFFQSAKAEELLDWIRTQPADPLSKIYDRESELETSTEDKVVDAGYGISLVRNKITSLVYTDPPTHPYFRARPHFLKLLELGLKFGIVWSCMQGSKTAMELTPAIDFEFSAIQTEVNQPLHGHPLLRTTTAVAIRTEPRSDAAAQSRLSRGHQVRYLAQFNSWVHVQYFDPETRQNDHGWVKWRHVIVEPPQSSNSTH